MTSHLQSIYPRANSDHHIFPGLLRRNDGKAQKVMYGVLLHVQFNVDAICSTDILCRRWAERGL
jgi:hypothetical protein